MRRQEGEGVNVLSTLMWDEELWSGQRKYGVRKCLGKKGRERRRSSRIKRREAEPGCEPGWRGCSAGT